MLKEFELLLEHTPPDTTLAEYRRLVVYENVLRKSTLITREHSFRKLKTLYALDPAQVIFRALRVLWDTDRDAHQLLAILCSEARDPLLRLASPCILQEPVGTVVLRDPILKRLEQGAPGRFSAKTLHSIAGNVLSSFEQSGHLSGKVRKIRTRPHATPVNAVYAFLLAYLEGYRGRRILISPWAALLDQPAAALIDLALSASQFGLCDFRHVGDVIDLRFPALLTPEEEEWTRVRAD